MGRIWIIGGHRRIVTSSITLVIVVVFGIGARGNACLHRGGVILIVDGEIGESRLWEWLRNKFTFLIFEMRVIANSFLLGLSGSFKATLFLLALDDIADALRSEEYIKRRSKRYNKSC